MQLAVILADSAGTYNTDHPTKWLGASLLACQLQQISLTQYRDVFGVMSKLLFLYSVHHFIQFLNVLNTKSYYILQLKYSLIKGKVTISIAD